jgi:hypothetical protein
VQEVQVVRFLLPIRKYARSGISSTVALNGEHVWTLAHIDGVLRGLCTSAHGTLPGGLKYLLQIRGDEHHDFNEEKK